MKNKNLFSHIIILFVFFTILGIGIGWLIWGRPQKMTLYRARNGTIIASVGNRTIGLGRTDVLVESR